MEKEQILAVVRQANTLLKEKKYADALELLDQLDTDGEEGGLICFMRGNAHMLLEDDQQAHLCYSEALNKGFADKHLFINFAVVKSRLGNLLQAEMLFRQAADLDPTDALPLNRILLLRLARRDFEGAEAVMDGLMESNPELVDGYHHQFAAPALPFGHSQHPELMEIKCEEVNSDEDCLTPEPSAAVSYQQGCPEEHEMERAFLERAQNDSPISRVEIPIESSVSPSGRDSLLHSSVGLLPRFPEREGFVLVHK